MEYIDFCKNNKYLVTGAAGFIGSNLCEYLLKKGGYVVGIDNFQNSDFKYIDELRKYKNFVFYEGDIKDYEFCVKITQNIDIVFHEAAWSSVPKSIEFPLEYTKNNILGMHNILHASYINNVKGVIYASSASVYGDNRDKIKIVGNEGEVLSPYALSKKYNEELAKMYTKLYNIKTVGLRYFNVFGRRQKMNSPYSAVIPKFIKSVLKNENAIIYGDGDQKRDFTYIDNIIEANVKSSIYLDKISGRIFNVGCGKSISVKDVYCKIINYLKKEKKIIYKNERKGEMKNSLADISDTKNYINYKANVNFDEGIIDTINWYLENKEK